MSVIGSNILAGASGQGGGYNLTKSLRFRSSASAYLNRTGSTATNAKLATYSFWFKRGVLTTGQWIFTGGASGAVTLIGFNGSSDALSVLLTDVSGEGNITTAVFRDPSAWYHFVIAINTSQATTADRAKIYVNGVLQSVTVANGGIGLNSNWGFNTANTLNIGRYTGGSSYTDGYLAEVNFIDGQALTPSSFGETSTTTGVWIPKKYTGTYGTNGFYLPFTDNSALTTSSNVGLGKDFSGNANYFATNNISITAGSTYDSMTDVPTLTSATAANYATFNPIGKSSVGSSTPSNGNLNVLLDRSSNNPWIQSTIAFPSSGKWYLEYSQTTINTTSTPYNFIGVMDVTTSTSTPVSSVTGLRGYYLWDGRKVSGTTATSYGSGTALNDIIGVAVDMDSGKIWFAVNNTWVNSGSPTGGTNAAFTDLTGTTWSFFNSILGETTSNSWVNFGQRPFTYTPPTGFVALNTYNLPTPTIGATASTTANKYFDATLYTGNNSTNNIVNSGSMQPDMLWIKGRSQSSNHTIQDSVRGVNRYLLPNLTGSEGTDGCVTAFNSNGFSLTTDAGVSFNANGTTYVGWQWRASNATAVTNTAGSITSTVSANTTAGFSIVTYTGNGTAGATVGHGLGVAPDFIILKNKASSNWWVYPRAMQATYSGEWLYLNFNFSHQGTASANDAPFYKTNPTSTVFYVAGDGANTSSNNYVAYCFAQVAGYSAFGSYTGNGSSDGPFIFTGFRPRFIMIKRTDTTNNWVIQDTSRDTYNVSEKDLYADTSGAEATYAAEKTDILSNGFKQRQTGASMNASGGTYIYMAFAESPFRYSNAR